MCLLYLLIDSGNLVTGNSLCARGQKDCTEESWGCLVLGACFCSNQMNTYWGLTNKKWHLVLAPGHTHK